MTAEYCAGAIIFRREEAGDLRYFLLRYPVRSGSPQKEYWGFVKGHIEAGENLLATAVREAQEETGLKDLKFIDGFEEKENYFLTKDKERVCKMVTFLLAETQNKDIVLSPEHLDFTWLPYQEALARLTFRDAKNLLEKANKFLLR